MTEEEVVEEEEEEEEEEEVLLSTLTLGSSSRLRFPSPSIVDDVVGSCCSGVGINSVGEQKVRNNVTTGMTR